MKKCSVCKENNAIPELETCHICTTLAVKQYQASMISVGANAIMPVEESLSETIGKLDRSLSEFLLLTEGPLDMADAQTLKHHADDLMGVGQHAKKKLADRGVT